MEVVKIEAEDKSKVDDHALGIIRVGRVAERLVTKAEDNVLGLVSELLSRADEVGLNLQEVAAALETETEE